MSGAEVMAVVLAGGSLVGLAMFSAWKLGFMQGEAAVSDLWLKAIKAEADVSDATTALKPEHIFWCEICSLNRVPRDGAVCGKCFTPSECKCGGLCPGCAHLKEKNRLLKMKLTAQRIGLPITGRLNSAFDAVAFYRRHMRRAALNWRKWRDTRCHEYKADALREARYYRNQSQNHQRKNQP